MENKGFQNAPGVTQPQPPLPLQPSDPVRLVVGNRTYHTQIAAVEPAEDGKSMRVTVEIPRQEMP